MVNKKMKKGKKAKKRYNSTWTKHHHKENAKYGKKHVSMKKHRSTHKHRRLKTPVMHTR